jgi:hypothetical protein
MISARGALRSVQLVSDSYKDFQATFWRFDEGM